MPFPYSIGVIDDFNRADAGTLGSNWTASGSYASLGISANKARGASGAWHGNIWNPAQYGPDVACYMTVSFASAIGEAVLLIRCASAAVADTYYLYISGSAWSIRTVVSGSDGALASGGTGTQAVANGGLIGIEAVGTTLAAYYSSNGGSSWTTVATGTDSSHSGAGYVGLQANSNDADFDDFAAGAMSAQTPPYANVTITAAWHALRSWRKRSSGLVVPELGWAI